MLAFLTDGESWSSSALALALGASQRTVQRALDALAAAQAELGRYKDAAATQRRALAAGGDSAMEARLKLYEDGKPYRE